MHSGSSIEGLRRWKLALQNPFDPKVCGVRIPDPYSYPTSSFKTEGTLSVTSDALGSASLLMLAQPYLSFINMNISSSITTSIHRYAASDCCYSVVPRQVL